MAGRHFIYSKQKALKFWNFAIGSIRIRVWDQVSTAFSFRHCNCDFWLCTNLSECIFPVHDKGSLALNVPVTYSVKRLFNQRDVSYRDWHEKDEQTINQREQQRGKNDWIMLSAPFSPTRPSIQQILAWNSCKVKLAMKIMWENQENLHAKDFCLGSILPIPVLLWS